MMNIHYTIRHFDKMLQVLCMSVMVLSERCEQEYIT